jgi:hypothetical protein
MADAQASGQGAARRSLPPELSESLGQVARPAGKKVLREARSAARPTDASYPTATRPSPASRGDDRLNPTNVQ